MATTISKKEEHFPSSDHLRRVRYVAPPQRHSLVLLENIRSFPSDISIITTNWRLFATACSSSTTPGAWQEHRDRSVNSTSLNISTLVLHGDIR
ncbi:hypothetical protein PLICRDRAFT_315137 [Plicaturopsis crispa FD-325 SS-3]|nr:hypothetical protein PLICRDRAFT_315137 [Plicaturopsis crispa FD-325 SS-3]